MNARICGSTRWIWSRQAWMISREETSRRASLGTSSEMVSWLSMGSSRPHGLAAARGESGGGGSKTQNETEMRPALTCVDEHSVGDCLTRFDKPLEQHRQ